MAEDGGPRGWLSVVVPTPGTIPFRHPPAPGCRPPNPTGGAGTTPPDHADVGRSPSIGRLDDRSGSGRTDRRGAPPAKWGVRGGADAHAGGRRVLHNANVATSTRLVELFPLLPDSGLNISMALLVDRSRIGVSSETEWESEGPPEGAAQTPRSDRITPGIPSAGGGSPFCGARCSRGPRRAAAGRASPGGCHLPVATRLLRDVQGGVRSRFVLASEGHR